MDKLIQDHQRAKMTESRQRGRGNILGAHGAMCRQSDIEDKLFWWAQYGRKGDGQREAAMTYLSDLYDITDEANESAVLS